MAVFESARKVWELHDNLGGGDYANETLFENLVLFLSGDTLDDFVDDFRRQHGMLIEFANKGDDFFSDREANPHDGSMYGEPEGGYDDDENTESFDLNLIQCSEV